MSIARKFTWALAACLSMGSAIAATATESFVSGTGTLDFMSNEFRALRLLGISTTYQLPDGNPLPVNAAQYSLLTRSATLTFDGGTISAIDGKASFSAGNSQLALLAGRAQEDEYGTPDYELPLLINLVALRNISFDLSDASISADITSYTGTTDALHLASSFGRLTVFKAFTPITDGTQGLVIDGQVSGSTASGLRLTDEGADIVLTELYAWSGQPLDKEAPSSLYVLGKTMSWGVSSATGTFSSSVVPEASTLSLMLVGLLSITAISRRSSC